MRSRQSWAGHLPHAWSARSAAPRLKLKHLAPEPTDRRSANPSLFPLLSGMSEAPQQQQRPRHRRSRFSLEPLASPAALLEVFKSLHDPALVDRNPAGAVLQLVRCTQAVGSSPLELGVAGGAGEGLPGW